MKDKKLNLIDCYIVQQGASFSHGGTLKSAMDDLQFKLAKDREAEQYKSLTLNSELTLAEAKTAYRIITGACQFGTEQFVDSLKTVKEKYTVAEMLKVTQGQFGADIFNRFFEV